ncbi:hypothetical protein D3C76_1105470 [compost metagenome]
MPGNNRNNLPIGFGDAAVCDHLIAVLQKKGALGRCRQAVCLQSGQQPGCVLRIGGGNKHALFVNNQADSVGIHFGLGQDGLNGLGSNVHFDIPVQLRGILIFFHNRDHGVANAPVA